MASRDSAIRRKRDEIGAGVSGAEVDELRSIFRLQKRFGLAIAYQTDGGSMADNQKSKKQGEQQNDRSQNQGGQPSGQGKQERGNQSDQGERGQGSPGERGQGGSQGRGGTEPKQSGKGSGRS